MILQPRTRRARGATAVLSAALFAAMGLSAFPASAVPSAGPSPATPVPTQSGHRLSVDSSKVDSSKLGAGLDRSGRHSVFVEFTGAGAADTASIAKKNGKSKGAAAAAAKDRRSAVATTAGSVVRTAQGEDTRARKIFEVANAVPGVAVNANSAALRAIAARSDVVKVTPLVPKKVSNASAAQLTRVLNTWQDLGNTGKGVKVGVIDTGLDYTHADFGGTGTVDAWDTAHANEKAASWNDTLPALAKAKIFGGHDFVGDDYDADPTSPQYQPVPHPDTNPIDCAEHGTHVSGTVAGYGVDASDATFTGDYSKLTGPALDTMRVGPGMAPDAQLYPMKVFGCTGSTDVVIPALDWSLDPNGDGDFADHLDIVNLSLGSDYGAVDDPENDVIDEIASKGVLPVIAMGNNGDLTDTGGSPGNAVRSLAVASSIDAMQLRDGLKVNAPVGVAGIAAGQVSVAYDWANRPAVTGDVVAIPGDNADGCARLSTDDASRVKGKVAWLEWDDNDATRRCGSVGRSGNVRAAGATGAIFTSGLNVFGAGITGDKDIPVFQLPKAQTDRLRPALSGPLNVTFDGSLVDTIKDKTPSIEDTISGFTSRGTHGSLGVVKPDVTAPGDTIASAKMGSGSDVLVISGTSMATPHTAGISALVKAAHPGWSTEQIKADVINTAGHDLFTGENHTGDKYGPARVGAGRVDARSAVANDVLVYSSDTPGAVSASFGVVPAPITKRAITLKRHLTVQNVGESATRLSLSYDAVNEQPGVSYSVSPARVTVKAGRTAAATVTMTVTTKALRRSIDPTMETDQLGVPRQFVSDASGRVLVTPAGKDALRVPVYGAAKPISETMAKSLGNHRILLRGTGVSQGSGSEAFNSLVSVMQLGASSPKLPTCTAQVTVGCTFNETSVAGDLQYVGAGSSPGATGFGSGVTWFGISTFGDWATIGNTTIPYVYFDTTGDGKADYEVYVANYPGTDVLLSNLVDLNAGEVIDQQPANFQFGDVDTNVFDTNVLLIPVLSSAIGVTDGAKKFPITYTVGMNSVYGTLPGGDIDTSGPVKFDVVKSAVGTDSPLYLDAGNTRIGYNHGSSAGKGAAKALVLHLHGAAGHRAEVVRLQR